jgi:malate dehydrogenase (oxaloacetate-decarboxylating)
VIGLGAAGTAIARLVKRFGVDELLCHDPDPRAVARAIAVGAKSVAFSNLMATANIVVAVTGRGNLIAPELIRKGQIVLALSNPEPEIEPKAALAAGAALASDGRTINNALAFPGLMRGAIEARARAINHEMMIEAARLIASRTEPGELVPSPLARELHDAIAAGVVRHARKTGMAGTAAP